LLVGTTMLMQVTSDVVTLWVVHAWHTWGHECQEAKIYGCWEGSWWHWSAKIMQSTPPSILHKNHELHFQLQAMGIDCHFSPKYCWLWLNENCILVQQL
jgi:hypothetical protein